MDADTAVDLFWQQARSEHPELLDVFPDVWSFGATSEQADELLGLVLSGVKTGTASSLWDCEHDDEPPPHPGDLSIVLDGRDLPRVLIRTTDVGVVPFGEVTAEHAAAEGEGDLSLAYWRQVHQRFWELHSTDPRRFAPDMPVVCERFEVVWVPDT
jgi:histidinol-phosphate aminotransferase